ncbi:hypothetical protein P0D91_00655 [Pseudomonas sp. CBSPBW29]|uniref:hypothetical protein n=1 Tax=Pseudomonas TaxID=286 RepID=UPI0021ABE9DF|nr:MULTISPECIES: hypothetical protein [unclassified Pseudomonas]WEL42928.1 hypothetical protein P0D91_00655 [Pseudomonas sp. CBSPBW29]WEL63997.1 hypothetical protein P0D93_28240 [Pseudomonas sp. CBSPGW29]WEL73185.1 hypothetical protein P0D94_14155 [Pseudomonas sp. CBSPCGW29]WEL74495.1 hypothetical protein P0D92_20205 [Pseudomonas sp. CBSPAW29]WEL81265.1 hypothetical protein P0D95_25620 [Pseudomonas sp. CBSPCAW29]WEL89764.1 hypothetical protein P0D90_07945 [Pseudomonas sp. CBSPCBW29]
MWQFQSIENPSGASLWFSDGEPLEVPRGGKGVSSRLIVEGQGFLDVTDFQNGFPNGPVMDMVNLNGQVFNYTPNPSVDLTLSLPGNGTFSATQVSKGITLSGQLKPLPVISAADVNDFNQMIEDNYVPYQNIPDAPGKTTAQIAALGLQLFPFTPYSFQLAMAVYDWTTASFTRVVLMKIFEYTSIGSAPYPLDQASIAAAIWESNWGTYTPQNVDYMNSFMMVPANSLQNVQNQLAQVAPALQTFSDVENRLLCAAFQSLPRTSIVSEPQLFSGQVDISQLGTEHFGIEFLQCPLNDGPVGTPLQIPLEVALDTYIQVGQVITSKMVWSFGSSLEEAMQYQNGIVLTANPPNDAWVWDTVSYITALSDDPTKIEYTFAPGSSFEVLAVAQTTVQGKQVWSITLQPLV